MLYMNHLVFTCSNVVGVLPTSHTTSPFDRARGRCIDACWPETTKAVKIPISVDVVDFIDGADNPIINTKGQVIELPIDLIN